MNPNEVVIQGDLSRADVRVLSELCLNKSVIEFGVGGSTLILARVASSLISYDTDSVWLNRTANRLLRLEDKICEPSLILIENVPDDIPECDVLFIDGYFPHRSSWLKHLRRSKAIICHDSLGGDTESGPALYRLFDNLFKDMELISLLSHIDFHYLDSNMAVIYRRSDPIYYVNWNLVEPYNRLNPYDD